MLHNACACACGTSTKPARPVHWGSPSVTPRTGEQHYESNALSVLEIAGTSSKPAWPVHWAHPLSPPGLVCSTTSSTLSLRCCCTHHYTSRLEALVAQSGVRAASLPPPQQRSAPPHSLHCKDGGLDREEPGAQVPRRRAVPAGQGDACCLKFADNHFSPSSPRRSRAGRNSCSCKSSSLGSRFEPHLLLKLANNQFRHKVRHS